jgi:hypothetical protein
MAPNVPRLHATSLSATCSARNSTRSVITSRFGYAASGSGAVARRPTTTFYPPVALGFSRFDACFGPRSHCPSQSGEWHRSPANLQAGSGRVDARKCPLWVISRHRSTFNQCPLCPQKRTLLTRWGMSALCQKQIFCTAAVTSPIQSTRRQAIGTMQGRSAQAP